MLVLKILWLFSIIVLLGSEVKCQEDQVDQVDQVDNEEIPTNIDPLNAETSSSKTDSTTKLEAPTITEDEPTSSSTDEQIIPVILNSESTNGNIGIPQPKRHSPNVANPKNLNKAKDPVVPSIANANIGLTKTLAESNKNAKASNSYKIDSEDSPYGTGSSHLPKAEDASTWSSLNLQSNPQGLNVQLNKENVNGEVSNVDNAQEAKSGSDDQIVDDHLKSPNPPISPPEQEAQNGKADNVALEGESTTTEEATATTDITVEDLFNQTNSDLEASRQKPNSVPLNEVIDRWLAEQKENRTLAVDTENSTQASHIKKFSSSNTEEQSPFVPEHGDRHHEGSLALNKSHDHNYEAPLALNQSHDHGVEATPVESLSTTTDIENLEFEETKPLSERKHFAEIPSVPIDPAHTQNTNDSVVKMNNSKSVEEPSAKSEILDEATAEAEYDAEVLLNKKDLNGADEDYIKSDQSSTQISPQKKATAEVNNKKAKINRPEEIADQSQPLQHDKKVRKPDTSRLESQKSQDSPHLINTGSFESQILKPTAVPLFQEKENVEADAFPKDNSTEKASNKENEESVQHELLIEKDEDAGKSFFDSTVRSLTGDVAKVQHFSRMALPDDSDSSSNIPLDKAETLKEDPKDYDNHLYYGELRNDEGILYTSLNFSVKVFLNGTPVHLTPNVSIESSYDPQNSYMEFKWYDVNDRYYVSAIFDALCSNGYCFVDDVHVKLSEHSDPDMFWSPELGADEVVVEQSNVELFKTKIGTTFASTTSTDINMEHGIVLELSNVEFSALHDLNEPISLADKCFYETYYAEIIGGTVGSLFLGVALLYTIKKWRKGRTNFKPTLA